MITVPSVLFGGEKVSLSPISLQLLLCKSISDTEGDTAEMSPIQYHGWQLTSILVLTSLVGKWLWPDCSRHAEACRMLPLMWHCSSRIQKQCYYTWPLGWRWQSVGLAHGMIMIIVHLSDVSRVSVEPWVWVDGYADCNELQHDLWSAVWQHWQWWWQCQEKWPLSCWHWDGDRHVGAIDKLQQSSGRASLLVSHQCCLVFILMSSCVLFTNRWHRTWSAHQLTQAAGALTTVAYHRFTGLYRMNGFQVVQMLSTTKV